MSVCLLSCEFMQVTGDVTERERERQREREREKRGKRRGRSGASEPLHQGPV